ncbi:OmpA family protein [Sneathiella limimaris]|uniref:OmpA family protein n=1 Tax=Sneathiella limimaris TaxID=1964213 RepID=UPI00146AA301|nr:OmpA family protein [Sneathiella limimaris]
MARVGKRQIQKREFQFGIGTVSLLVASLLAVPVTAQTVVIGGSGSRPVTVNMGAISGNQVISANPPSVSTPSTMLSQGQAGSDYSKGATITYGNEVIKLVPPGSRPKATPKPKTIQKTKQKTQTAEKKSNITKVAEKAPETEKPVEKAPAPKADVAQAKKPMTSTEAKGSVKSSTQPDTVASTETASKSSSATPVAKEMPTTEPAQLKPKETAQKAEPAQKEPEVKQAEPSVAQKSPEEDKEKEVQVAAVEPKQVTAPSKSLKKIEPIKQDSSADQNSIMFEEGETTLPSSATSTLMNLAKAIEGNNDRIQLVAYANASSNGTARRLSLGRALVIRSKLMELGVPNNKIEVRALGKPDDGSPADRVDLKMVTR